MTKDEIHFTVLENNSKHSVVTYQGEYRSLMLLLIDKIYLEEFGECGGMGRCATCIIKISGLTGDSKVKERNEPATLSKLGFEADDIRLACQLLITHDLDNTVIQILE